MRFMILVKATPQTEAEGDNPLAGLDPNEAEKLLVDMGKYHEDLAKAGVLLDGNGLKPSSRGFRIKYSGHKRTVIDGPFAEAKELIAGYTLIQVKSRDEALEWAKRMPNPAGPGKEAEIEVRQLFEFEDFGPSPAVERMRDQVFGKIKK